MEAYATAMIDKEAPVPFVASGAPRSESGFFTAGDPSRVKGQCRQIITAEGQP
jgi:hypothetical protein